MKPGWRHIKMKNLQNRRKILALASGGLILAGLAAGRFFGAETLRTVLMVAAALVAGQDIALRAWHSLRNRHISIELLVTIAAGGALIIGEVWEAAAVTVLFIFGAYLEARTLNQTRQVLGSLLDLAPTMAIVVRSGRQVTIASIWMQHGQLVVDAPATQRLAPNLEAAIVESYELSERYAF